MTFEKSQTEKNLRAAFAAESQARNRYTLYSGAARAAGYDDLADVFEELAANEAEHAKREFEFLGGIGEVRDAVRQSIEGEHLEQTEIYPSFAKTAQEEGFAEIAEFFQRMSQVEAAHERRLRDLLDSIEGKREFAGKTVLHSATRLAHVMMPDQANPAGFVHGGELMKLIDNAAGVAALRHCRKNVVLARVADIQFLNPVRVGNLVLIDARLTFVSRSTMEVMVELDTESARSGTRRRAMTAHLIMVGLEKDGKPAEVPPLLISTEEQQRLYDEGKARHEGYRRAKKAR